MGACVALAEPMATVDRMTIARDGNRSKARWETQAEQLRVGGGKWPGGTHARREAVAPPRAGG